MTIGIRSFRFQVETCLSCWMENRPSSRGISPNRIHLLLSSRICILMRNTFLSFHSYQLSSSRPTFKPTRSHISCDSAIYRKFQGLYYGICVFTLFGPRGYMFYNRFNTSAATAVRHGRPGSRCDALQPGYTGA